MLKPTDTAPQVHNKIIPNSQ